MKFSCVREELDKQLQFVSRVVTTRSTLPILSNLLLETDGKLIRISATDLELAIATTVPAEVGQQGSFTVPAKLFQDFVHQNPDTEVEFSLRSSELHCVSKQVTATIPGIDPEEYPPLPSLKSATKEVVLQTNQVITALKQVVIACAQDQGRPVLTSVFTKITPGSLTFAATDSFRLVERVIPITSQETIEVLIPARTIQELIRIVGQQPNQKEMRVLLDDNQLVIQVGGVEIYSRLLSGNFPKYEAIIPKEFTASLSVDVAEFTQALRLSTVFSSSGITNVIISVQEDGLVFLSNYATQKGGAKYALPCEVEKPFQAITTAFNTRYLLEALGATNEERVNLQLSGKTTPLIVSVGSPEYTQLVMPIRLES